MQEDAQAAVVVVVEFDDDVGLANYVGQVVERAIELEMKLLLVLLRLALGRTRIRGDRRKGKRPDQKGDEDDPPPHSLLPDRCINRKVTHDAQHMSNRRAKRRCEVFKVL